MLAYTQAIFQKFKVRLLAWARVLRREMYRGRGRRTLCLFHHRSMAWLCRLCMTPTDPQVVPKRHNILLEPSPASWLIVHLDGLYRTSASIIDSRTKLPQDRMCVTFVVVQILSTVLHPSEGNGRLIVVCVVSPGGAAVDVPVVGGLSTDQPAVCGKTSRSDLLSCNNPDAKRCHPASLLQHMIG